MADVSVSLTAEECEYLVEHLQGVLSQTLVEEHRTESSRYRERIQRDEELLRGLLTKLRPTGK